MKKIIINDKEYKLLKDNRDAFDLEVVESLMTDYFDEFDYVVGDWSYGKLRLKCSDEKCGYTESNKNSTMEE